MKSSDIITQLVKVLPQRTSLFHDEISISTLVKSGSTVTATTTSAHGLSTGNYVYVQGAKRKTPVASITRSGTTATVTTSTPHDLTELWFTNVELTGSDQAGYNGVHTLLSVPNRNIFTMEVDSGTVTPSTGTIYLLEPWRAGFNGWYYITVTGATTFTYTSSDSFSGSADGTMTVRVRPRISGALNVERALASYTKLQATNLWAFVVLGDVVASKDRLTLMDSIASHTGGSNFRQTLLNKIYIYVICPTRDTLSGRAERDLMTDVNVELIKALVGKVFPTYFAEDPVTTLNFVTHKFFMWHNTFYVHVFEFEGTSDITKNDIIEPEFTRAFRDLTLNFDNEFMNTILETDINLDDDT